MDPCKLPSLEERKVSQLMMMVEESEDSEKNKKEKEKKKKAVQKHGIEVGQNEFNSFKPSNYS